MNGKMVDTSNYTNEQNLQLLYQNIKWNRQNCNEDGRYDLGVFWFGTLNGLYATLDNLGLNYEWIEGREKDFNEYLENRKQLEKNEV